MDKLNSQGEKYDYMVHNRCGFAAGGEYCRVCPVRGGQTGGQAEKRRVPEKTLITWALLFGAAGVYLAMLIFSHKTKKPKFSVLAPAALAVQAALAGWIFWRLG